MSGAFWSKNLWLSAASLVGTTTTAPRGFLRKHRMLYFPPVSRLGSSWRRPSYAGEYNIMLDFAHVFARALNNVARVSARTRNS
eukprot:scaffold72635_cov55-Attheya_sp.AAC.2